MEETDSTSPKNKWFKRLALLFLLLFALLWSLGSFFFWTLLGLFLSFSLLAFYSSGIQISFFDRTEPENPYRAYPASARPSTPQNQFVLVRKIIRALVIGFGGMMVLLFVAGIFSNKNTSAPSDAENTESSEPVLTDETTDYVGQGNASFDKGQYDSAVLFYDKVLAIDPDDQYALYNKALVFYMKQDYRKSISLVRKCLKRHPDYDVGWWLLGDDYASISNYDSATVCLEKAYSNGYTDPGFLQLMADVYLKKGNRNKAKEFYLKVIGLDSTKAEVYRQLMELDPGNSNQYRNKVNALEQSPK